MNKIADNLSFILLNVGFSELDANWNWKNVNSPFARIYFVTGGEAKTYIDNKSYILKPGYLYLVPPFTLHDDESEGLFSLYYIHFYEKIYNRESIFEKLDFPIGIVAEELDALLVKRLLDINPERYLKYIDPEKYDNMPTFSKYVADSNRAPAHTIFETQGILYQLMAKFMEMAKLKSRYEDSRINKCLQYIHENTNKDVSIAQLADIACITKDHLIRIFKKETGYTPIKYINLKKMEKAQLLLLTSDLSVTDIALDLSIDNISYFNRLFKQQTGTTPSKYRSKYE